LQGSIGLIVSVLRPIINLGFYTLSLASLDIGRVRFKFNIRLSIKGYVFSFLLAFIANSYTALMPYLCSSAVAIAGCTYGVDLNCS
jgi:hypothetical protein